MVSFPAPHPVFRRSQYAFLVPGPPPSSPSLPIHFSCSLHPTQFSVAPSYVFLVSSAPCPVLLFSHYIFLAPRPPAQFSVTPWTFSLFPSLRPVFCCSQLCFLCFLPPARVPGTFSLFPAPRPGSRYVFLFPAPRPGSQYVFLFPAPLPILRCSQYVFLVPLFTQFCVAHATKAMWESGSEAIFNTLNSYSSLGCIM